MDTILSYVNIFNILLQYLFDDELNIVVSLLCERRNWENKNESKLNINTLFFCSSHESLNIIISLVLHSFSSNVNREGTVNI